jgi:hypothetical protein
MVQLVAKMQNIIKLEVMTIKEPTLNIGIYTHRDIENGKE